MSNDVPYSHLPLVFLHGLMGNVSNWDRSFAYYEGTCRFLPIEFKVYGKGARYHTIDTLTEHVLAEMDNAKIDQAVVFGNSMGGQVALNVALTRPERVSALVLTGSAGLMERSYTNGTPLNPSREYIREKCEEIFYDPRHVTDELIDQLYDVFHDTKNKLRIVKLARSLRKCNMHADLPSIRCPTLLIWGREDIVTPLNVAEMFAERLPNAQIKIIDHCGHAPNIECPDDFNRLAEEFLCQVAAG